MEGGVPGRKWAWRHRSVKRVGQACGVKSWRWEQLTEEGGGGSRVWEAEKGQKGLSSSMLQEDQYHSEK